MNSATNSKCTIAVGASVEVWNYADPHEAPNFVGGYTVRAVEFEDYSVVKDGVGFVIAMHRVRAAR